METIAPIYLDELTVGAEFTSSEHTLDAEQIISFASQFDPQSFHLDDEAAKSSFFKGLAASGWHTAALTMKMIVDSLPIGSGVIGLGGEIEWPRPTRPGETIGTHTSVISPKVAR